MSMIATVSPGASSADHSINTLRYSDRTKEKGIKKSPIRKTSPAPATRTVAGGYFPQSSLSQQSQARTIKSNNTLLQNENRLLETEEILRQTVASIVEQEESILNMHMSNIQENADLLTREGEMLAKVQRPDRTPFDAESYATALEAILEQKEDMILSLRKEMEVYKENCRKEQELSKEMSI